MTNPKVSIIVPVYNVEDYLDQCLESLSKQSLKEIEILVVDNASTDNSPAIIEKWKNLEPRIRVFTHKLNTWSGGAYNTGIRNAKSEYIAIVDSDDWVDVKTFESVHQQAISSDYDIVVFGAYYTDAKGEKLPQSLIYPENKVYSDLEAFNSYMDMVKDYPIYNASWGKLWRRSLYTDNNITYSEKWSFEDISVTPRLLYQAKKSLLIKDVFYYYRQQPNSQTAQIKPEYLDAVKEFNIFKQFLLEKNSYEEYKDRLWKRFYQTFLTWWYYMMIVKKTSGDLYLKHFLEWCHRLYEELETEDLNCLSAAIGNTDQQKFPFLIFKEDMPEGPLRDVFKDLVEKSSIAQEMIIHS